MRPFLIVGCGGSGGVTLQFLMDQLKSDLRQYGISELPRAWQFVHVDVPVAPDGIRPGLPRTVDEQGGRYIGLASPGSTYATVCNAVTGQLAAQKQAAQLATWHADPQRVPASIVAGAGQMRTVGRIVTLSGLAHLQGQLRAALDALTSAGVSTELKDLARTVSPGTEVQATGAPVVVVLSSMAGGAGASMVLDVCRLLAQLPGCDPALTSLFLYTPEIFDALPADKRSGVPGNALALTGELIASQLGAATKDDAAIYKALGLGESPAGRGLPFGRVIPIGARVGATGSLFADGRLDDIYRGVGRGLSALMMSGVATNDWIAFDLTNNNPRPGSQDDFGWSAHRKDLQWGSFGFASLSTGRDRYGEYAAQRVARGAVERLVAGHRQPGDPATDHEQCDRRVKEVYEDFVTRLGLPGRQGTRAWLLALTKDWERDIGREATRATSEHIEQASAEASQWLELTEHHIRNDAEALAGRLADAAYLWVHRWYEQVLLDVEEGCRTTAANDGLPVLRQLLASVATNSQTWVQDLEEGRHQNTQSLAALPSHARARASAARGSIDGRHQLAAVSTGAYADLASAGALREVMQLLVQLLSGLRRDLLEPLREAAADALQVLQSAVTAPVGHGQLSQLHTDEYVEWPKPDQPPPARFTHAQNEVLLIERDTFEQQFDEHLVDTTRRHEGSATAAGRGDGLGTALREVVLDRWESTTTPSQERLIERDATWRPACLPRDPGMTDRVPMRRGRYRFAVRPVELLARSRDWVGRPNLPFATFVSTSLRSYIAGEGVTEAQRTERTREVRASFAKVLELAQPLVQVSVPLVSALHGGQRPQVSYKFSEVPFGDLTLAGDLVHDLEQRAEDSSGVSNLRGAMKPLSDRTRIDIFGSYAPLSPLTFSSLLRPLAQGWSAAVTPDARSSFWDTRRARRLPGGMAMSEQQRRAVVGGWFVARYTGRLRFPADHALGTVEVFDDSGPGEWLSFPDPLIVPQDLLDTSPNSLLPAVLLSHGLALAQTSAAEDLRPLRPYTVLRQCWDTSVEGRRGADRDLLTARKRLKRWLEGELPPLGAPLAFPAVADADQGRLDLLARITDGHTHVGHHYLPHGSEADGEGDYSQPRGAYEVYGYPLFHEVAHDVYVIQAELMRILDDDRLLTGRSHSAWVDVIGG